MLDQVAVILIVKYLRSGSHMGGCVFQINYMARPIYLQPHQRFHLEQVRLDLTRTSRQLHLERSQLL
jgi:hypothetical protein